MKLGVFTASTFFGLKSSPSGREGGSRHDLHRLRGIWVIRPRPLPLWKERRLWRQVGMSHPSSWGLWLRVTGCLCRSCSLSHSQKSILEKLKGNAWTNKWLNFYFQSREHTCLLTKAVSSTTRCPKGTVNTCWLTIKSICWVLVNPGVEPEFSDMIMWLEYRGLCLFTP